MFNQNKKNNTKKFAFLGFFRKVPISQKIFLVQQLGIMIKTGISLAIALKTLAEQATNKKLKEVLTSIEKDVESGQMFSKALEKYPDVFNQLFIGMIKAGESSGKLESVFAQLFVQMKNDHAIISKVRGAMIYPSVIIFAMIIVLIMVIVYVIPSLTTVFNEVNVTLPFTTKALIFLSEFVNKFGLFIIIGVVAASIAFVRVIKVKKGKKIFDQILLKIPIVNQIIIKINLARFCRTLSSLLKTDIPIVRTFEITSNVLGNSLFKEALSDAKEKIKKGVRVEESLAPYKKLFPPVVLQMISVGEETGTLDNILEESATFYEDDVSQTMTALPSIIEPVLIMILGVGVAIMAMAVIMPMYSLSQQI